MSYEYDVWLADVRVLFLSEFSLIIKHSVYG